MEEKIIKLAQIILEIIKPLMKPESVAWLEEKGRLVRDNVPGALSAAFAAVPRKTGRWPVDATTVVLNSINELYPGFTIQNWPADKLSRLWLLLQLEPSDEKNYHTQLENLFKDAEMNELAALYAALPVFAYPESWEFRTTEGIRSNIGTVLESIMYENPYPARYLSEPAWNQLVLKAFFTDKDINRITGLDERANKALASILIDYAHEREAAHRMVNPQLWRLVSKFIDENNVSDIAKLYEDAHITVRRAAVLACYHSSYEPARHLLQKEPAILRTIESNLLTWNSL